ncbi:MAG TPA: MogA/MoaB family molybdenum cofactor biosynthesis protein [Nitrospiria bacterium]
MGHKEHKAHAPAHVRCWIITVSDTRTPETDKSGKLIRDLLHSAGHATAGYQIFPDEPSRIRDALNTIGSQESAGAVILTGGTGISRRDGTVDVAESLFEKRLDGFGELFRSLSYAEIGSSAMLSRAAAGTFQNKVLFCLPGSTAGVRLAMEKLILPELGHLIGELSR